jgi:hypothetical protein
VDRDLTVPSFRQEGRIRLKNRMSDLGQVNGQDRNSKQNPVLLENLSEILFLNSAVHSCLRHKNPVL